MLLTTVTLSFAEYKGEGNDEAPPPILRIGPEVEEEQRRRLDKVRRERDDDAVARARKRQAAMAAHIPRPAGDQNCRHLSAPRP